MKLDSLPLRVSLYHSDVSQIQTEMLIRTYHFVSIVFIGLLLCSAGIYDCEGGNHYWYPLSLNSLMYRVNLRVSWQACLHVIKRSEVRMQYCL